MQGNRDGCNPQRLLFAQNLITCKLEIRCEVSSAILVDTSASTLGSVALARQDCKAPACIFCHFSQTFALYTQMSTASAYTSMHEMS